MEDPPCTVCEVGVASGTREGHFCPFVNRERKSGEIIYVEGEDAPRIWYLKRGTVVLMRKVSETRGEGQVRAVRFPGSFIGLEAMVVDHYLDTARAATDVALCGITRDGMDAWLGPPGTPARTALEMTLRTASMDLAQRAPRDGNAMKRVAAWLLDEGPGANTLELPRRILADLLGMRPETFSRALTSLADRGAIDVTRTTLRIADGDVLEEIAHGAGRRPS